MTARLEDPYGTLPHITSTSRKVAFTLQRKEASLAANLRCPPSDLQNLQMVSLEMNVMTFDVGILILSL